MTTNAVQSALLGCIATLAFVAGLFFLRYWLSSRDRFFIYFTASFWIESANRMHMALTAQSAEDSPLHYGIRLLSFLLILLAIWDKNRPRG